MSNQNNPYYLNEESQINPYGDSSNDNYQHSYNLNGQQSGQNFHNGPYFQNQQGNLHQNPNYSQGNGQGYHSFQSDYHRHRDRPIVAPRQGSSSATTLDHCPYCNEMTTSIIEQKYSCAAWIACIFLFWITVVLFWLPFCFDCSKQQHIRCVKCHRTKYVIKNGC